MNSSRIIYQPYRYGLTVVLTGLIFVMFVSCENKSGPPKPPPKGGASNSNANQGGLGTGSANPINSWQQNAHQQNNQSQFGGTPDCARPIVMVNGTRQTVLEVAANQQVNWEFSAQGSGTAATQCRYEITVQLNPQPQQLTNPQQAATERPRVSFRPNRNELQGTITLTLRSTGSQSGQVGQTAGTAGNLTETLTWRANQNQGGGLLGGGGGGGGFMTTLLPIITQLLGGGGGGGGGLGGLLSGGALGGILGGNQNGQGLGQGQDLNLSGGANDSLGNFNLIAPKNAQHQNRFTSTKHSGCSTHTSRENCRENECKWQDGSCNDH